MRLGSWGETGLLYSVGLSVSGGEKTKSQRL